MAYRKATIAAFATLSLGLGACEGMNTGDVIGSLGGGVGGAVLGSQIGGGTGRVAATAFGSLAGALAGQQLSRHLQGNDQTTAVQAEETAITRNEPIQWSSADSDRRGTIEPTRTFQNPGGQTCREYQHTVYIGGRAERANGTACQQPDGSWRIVS
ncbi:glycine zipper 2TM domain-containing protein [Skermanella rosea]|uniref:RT0821/Lpp0805 family surface protein n=1 Tax=Skermanella rosea TaxID=1817965 RepID=UPI001932E35C|nr:RT0821/Lpp0805 family surface protein [Skermanella rosea]UEM05686.1 glycine zipper 2TM domain-containing protein [Skermanella rosea]